MNAAISRKWRPVTFSDRITPRRNYENLIMQTDKFIIENDTWNLKFIMFYADNTNKLKRINVFSRKSNKIVSTN